MEAGMSCECQNQSQAHGEDAQDATRRDFLTGAVRLAALALLGGVSAWALRKPSSRGTVWQIDPRKCNQCGRCRTACVLTPSAVKCVHSYAICGYCELCGGYHRPGAGATDTAAENQLCPTAAIKRTYIEEPFYEYSIEEDRCIACAKCVAGCGAFGNGSLYLQVRHDRCVNCNECAIARQCPTGAFVRLPADRPYLLKDFLGATASATVRAARTV